MEFMFCYSDESFLAQSRQGLDAAGVGTVSDNCLDVCPAGLAPGTALPLASSYL